MIEIKMQDMIDNHFGPKDDFEYAADYILFRAMEDWCYENIPKDRWRLDFRHTICVCGIDIPGRIFFLTEQDASAFKLRFA